MLSMRLSVYQKGFNRNGGSMKTLIDSMFYTLQGIFAGYIILVACESREVYQWEATLLIIVAGSMLVSTINHFTDLMMNEDDTNV